METSYVRVPFISLQRQNKAIGAELLRSFVRVLNSGRYLMGLEVEALEDAIGKWHGVSAAVGLSSGTSACEIAIRACGWGEGQTVATPAFGAVPTINSVEAAGATPVLVDVDPRTRGISFETLSKVKTDGAIVVHMFGHPCDVPPGAIEDCAHAQGATFQCLHSTSWDYVTLANGEVGFHCPVCGTTGGFAPPPNGPRKLVGTIGRVGALSFFPTKCLGNMGDGGCIITNHPGVADRARAIRHYGMNDDGDVTTRGQNSRISELSAAFVREKLSRLDEWNKRRRQIAKRYSDELRGRVTVPYKAPNCEPTYHVYVIEHPERDRLKAALDKAGIGTMIHYSRAIHQHARWRRLGEPGQFPVSEKLAATVLSLPCFPELTEEEQDAVIAAVKEAT